MPPQLQNQSNQTSPTSQKMYIDLSGRGGLAPRWFGDEGDSIMQHPQYRYIGTQDQITATLGESTAYDLAAGIWNPSRRYGYMAPANNSFTSVTAGAGSFSNVIRATCYDPLSQTAFYAENGKNLWQNTSITTNSWTLNSNFTWPLTSALYFTNLAMYQINGVPFVFASYVTTTANEGDVLVMQPGGSGTGATATWLSGTASGSFNTGSNDHFFVPSNYYMYLCENNFVHRIDGTAATGGSSGTVIQNVLIAASNVVFTDGISWNGNIYLAASQTSAGGTTSSVAPFDPSAYNSPQARVYVWDESVTTIENVEYITIQGVKIITKMYATKSGKLRMIAVSSKRTLQIREYNGVTFDVIEESAITSYGNYRDSFQVAGDCVVWIGSDMNIYQHGPVVPGEIDQLTIIGNIAASIPTGHVAGFSGASLFIDNNTLGPVSRTGMSISVFDQTASSYLNFAWYPNTTGNTPHIGNVYSLVKFFQTPVKINYARVYHYATPISGSPSQIQGTIGVLINQATTPQKSFSVTRADISKGYKYLPIGQPITASSVSIQALVQWNISVTTSDTTDWLPRILEIDYSPIPRLL